MSLPKANDVIDNNIGKTQTNSMKNTYDAKSSHI